MLKKLLNEIHFKIHSKRILFQTHKRLYIRLPSDYVTDYLIVIVIENFFIKN